MSAIPPSSLHNGLSALPTRCQESMDRDPGEIFLSPSPPSPPPSATGNLICPKYSSKPHASPPRYLPRHEQRAQRMATRRLVLMAACENGW